MAVLPGPTGRRQIWAKAARVAGLRRGNVGGPRQPIRGAAAVIAVAWCTGIALAGFLWARALYNRAPAR